MTEKLEDGVAVVTGGSSGIGRSAAYALGMIGSADSIELLKKMLKDEGSSWGKKVKDAAIESLKNISRKNKIRIT